MIGARSGRTRSRGPLRVGGGSRLGRSATRDGGCVATTRCAVLCRLDAELTSCPTTPRSPLVRPGLPLHRRSIAGIAPARPPELRRRDEDLGLGRDSLSATPARTLQLLRRARPFVNEPCRRGIPKSSCGERDSALVAGTVSPPTPGPKTADRRPDRAVPVPGHRAMFAEAGAPDRAGAPQPPRSFNESIRPLQLLKKTDPDLRRSPPSRRPLLVAVLTTTGEHDGYEQDQRHRSP